MRRLIGSLIAALAFANAVFAVDWDIHDINVNVRLYRDGSAIVSEIWNISAQEGTEVYVPRTNLGDIEISDFSVSDETGDIYKFEERWDVDRSLARKAGRCGFHRISGGVELCWGLGSYGTHTYNVRYKMSNVVKSLNDYDMMHIQLINEELSAPPKHVKVTIEAQDVPIDTSWVRIWGFGFHGNASFEDGKAVYESTDKFRYESSLIALMRFDKGTFEPTSVQERPFQVVLDRALEGADEPDNPLPKWKERLYSILGALFFGFMCLIPFLPLVARIIQRRKDRKNAFGTLDLSSIDWSREIPYAGDILKNYYVISTSKDIKAKNNSVASAMILHMLQEGCLEAQRDLATGKVNIYFKENADFTKLDSTERGLWSMMLEASGDNRILEEKEFSSWASKHETRLYNWTQSIKATGLSKLRTGGYYQSSKYTDVGRAENRKVIGFKKFLEDTTLIKERTSPEVTLWREYLIFASLIGIAEQVAKELKDIDPVMFEKAYTMPYNDMSRVIRLSNSYSRVLDTHAVTHSYSGGGSLGGFSRSGGGGHSSFGGGGGFSGGGHSGVR